MRNLRLFYFGIDLRTLAVLRIALGSLLLFDLAKRIPGIGLWYVNSGLLPNHRVLWHPEPHQFSYLFALWTVSQVQVAFVVSAGIYLCFLCGYRTRLFHVLSWLTLLSLQTRTTFLANGGDYVFCTLLLWTAFMPLGTRWSIDELRTRPTSEVRDTAFVSLAVAALRVQLCVIYLFNALSKTGDTWTDGSAVHYLLHQARIVTPLGSGQHVDPFNTRASLVADPSRRSIPARLGQDVYFCNYTLRILDDEEFREAFHDWILGHARRTHQPEAAIEHFDAYVIEHDSPPLGQQRATNTKARIFLSGSRGE